MDSNEEGNPGTPSLGDKMDVEIQETATEPEPTPTPRRRGRPPKAKPNGSTPNSKSNVVPVFATPTKATGFNALTPGRAADRSARRKSARALIDRVVGDGGSDDDDEHIGDDITRQIYESSDAGDEDDGEDELEERTDGETASLAATPSKTPARRKGRPKRARSPTPPRDLPPHELYFLHNKPGRPKTSDNNLASLNLLSHDEYFSVLREHQDRHAENIEYLESLHAESFSQWAFELSQGFSICLYGLGSKRHLLRKFATFIHSNNKTTKAGKIVMVNGYAHTTNLREVLSIVASAIDPTQRVPTAQPAIMIQSIISLLSTTKLTITIIINSIDAIPLRKPGSQAILSQLAAHPQINLVGSADTPDFPLLWDIGVRSGFNFVFHDCTTFSPFMAELDVVDDVHELLGRQSQRVNGREGVAFVLKSLTENAKNLFRLLVGEVLIAMEDEGDDGVGLEYRMVYNKAVEEFICSSEMAFRTLLKEFHDHQMLISRKDNLGTELLSLPFRKEDLEAILEDLTA
ncbi:origin recognition complex subunit 2 domain-containing protein [Trichoderma barbatum]